MAINVCPCGDLSDAETPSDSVPGTPKFNERSPADMIIPVLTAQTCPVLLAPRQKISLRQTATGAVRFLAGAFFFSLTPDFSRVAAGGMEANGFNRFRRRSIAGICQAVETALAGATLATGLKPGVNEKLQNSEMRPWFSAAKIYA